MLRFSLPFRAEDLDKSHSPRLYGLAPLLSSVSIPVIRTIGGVNLLQYVLFALWYWLASFDRHLSVPI